MLSIFSRLPEELSAPSFSSQSSFVTYFTWLRNPHSGYPERVFYPMLRPDRQGKRPVIASAF